MGAWLQGIFGTAALFSLWVCFKRATRRDGNPETPDNRSRRGMRCTMAIIMLGGLAAFYLVLSVSTALGWSKSTRAVVFIPALIIVIVISIVVGARVKAGHASQTSDGTSGSV